MSFWPGLAGTLVLEPIQAVVAHYVGVDEREAVMYSGFLVLFASHPLVSDDAHPLNCERWLVYLGARLPADGGFDVPDLAIGCSLPGSYRRVAVVVEHHGGHVRKGSFAVAGRA